MANNLYEGGIMKVLILSCSTGGGHNSCGRYIEEELKNISKPVIIDFFASWCGPCKMLSPVLEKISSKFGDSIEIIKIDIDEYPDIANKYEIMSVPTLMFFLNGELLRRETGFVSEEKILEMIKSDFCVSSKC